MELGNSSRPISRRNWEFEQPRKSPAKASGTNRPLQDSNETCGGYGRRIGTVMYGDGHTGALPLCAPGLGECSLLELYLEETCPYLVPYGTVS
jgi:hypothetical protein